MLKVGLLEVVAAPVEEDEAVEEGVGETVAVVEAVAVGDVDDEIVGDGELDEVAVHEDDEVTDGVDAPKVGEGELVAEGLALNHMGHESHLI